MNTPTLSLSRKIALSAALAAFSWAALAVILFLGTDHPGIIAGALVPAVVGTVFTVVDVAITASKRTNPGGIVTALLTPAIALAAMTPLFAVLGVVVLAYAASAFAAEFVIVAIIFARRDRQCR